MNKIKRQKLKIAYNKLTEGKRIIDSVYDDESACLDNLPEGLLESKSGNKISESVEILESVQDNIDEAIDLIRQIIPNFPT